LDRPGAEARIDFPALRGAEAPLFHGAANVLPVPCKIKIKVKGVGQECPTHTSNPESKGFPQVYFFDVQITLLPILGRGYWE